MGSEQKPAEQKIIGSLIARIRQKLAGFGINKKQANKRIVRIITEVLRVRMEGLSNPERVLFLKIKANNMESRLLKKLIIELDVYLHSLHDNYDASSSEVVVPPVKLEAEVPEGSDPAVKQPMVKQEVQQAVRVGARPTTGNIGNISEEISRYQRRRSNIRLLDEEAAQFYSRRLVERRRIIEASLLERFLERNGHN